MTHSNKTKRVRATTLADVGLAAGVSAMAVSAVLNGALTSSRIAPKTRKRILETAALLNYRANGTARALASRRMHTIGVAGVVDGNGLEFNHYFLEILSGILMTAGRREENTTLFTLHEWSPDPEPIRRFCDGRIDGLILIAPRLTVETGRMFPAYTPFVAVHANCPLPGVINVESDEEDGAYEVTRHLIARGHRDIIHITGPRGLLGAERRIRGFERAIVNAGIHFDSSRLVEASFTTSDGRIAMRQWLKAHVGDRLPQAAFCASDAIAVCCMEALAELGLRVPDDISIAGFDDTFTARTTVPQLTTVRQPLWSMGNRAAEILLDRIEHPERPLTDTPNPVVFPVEVISRASVASPPVAARVVPPQPAAAS